jgi:nucleoside-diphosphate-sugar epimerase
VVEITGGKLNMQFESVPPGDAIFTGSCDTRKAKDLLGWEPKIDLRTGLKMMYEDMKMHRYDECGNILIDSNVLYEKI